MKIGIEKLVARLAYILFFLMLFVPTIYQLPKAILLSLVLLCVAIKINKSKKIRLHYNVLVWFLGLILINLVFVTYGVFNGNSGAIRVSTVFIIWPILYAILISTINEKIIYNLVKVMQLSTIMIGIYSLLYILHSMDLVPNYLFISLYEDQGIDLDSEVIEYSVRSLSSLVFLVPFNIASLICWPSGHGLPVKRKWLLLGSILGISAVLLSGRRALLLVLILAPAFALIFRYFLPLPKKNLIKKDLRNIVFICFIIIVFAITFFDTQVFMFVNGILTIFSQGFDFNYDISASIRKEQFYVLLDEWSKSPLFGAGHGAAATGIIRSIEAPWTYELSYLALLFQIGLVGVFIHIIAITWIIYNGIKIIQSGSNLGFVFIPTLTGMCCFLVANATNPYLLKFDFLWTIFFPIAIINYNFITGTAHRRIL